MAADGSLKFDTKINVEGFEEGISTLSKAMDRLTGAVNRLSSNILSRFNGAGQAITKTAQSAGEASDAVESIGESADGSLKDVKRLQEQMDAIRVQAMEPLIQNLWKLWLYQQTRNHLITTQRLWLQSLERKRLKYIIMRRQLSSMVNRGPLL